MAPRPPAAAPSAGVRRAMALALAATAITGCQSPRPATSAGGAAAPASPSPTVSRTAAPTASVLVGTWHGEAHQVGDAPGDFALTITLVSDPGGALTGSLHIPSVPCTGRLLASDAPGPAVTLALTFPGPGCTDGSVTLTPAADGSLAYRWTATDGSSSSEASLTRT